ncbi:hypothetical protein ACQY0O_005660 [Thecaphora frezii]
MADFFATEAPSAAAQQDDTGAGLAAPSTPQRRGHLPQLSVGNAATLFGGSGDDPFASIASPSTPADPSIQPDLFQQQAQPAATEPADAAAALFGGSPAADTPQPAAGTASDDFFGGSAPAGGAHLEVPGAAAAASSASSAPPSPSKLFPSASAYSDDWLGGAGADAGAGGAAVEAPATTAFDQTNQDSLDWLNCPDPHATAAATAATADAQHSYGYDAQGAQAGYDAQGQYVGGPYHAQAGQGYAEQGYYDNQAYNSQGYDAQQYGEQAYGYDYSQQLQPQEQEQPQQHHDYSQQQQPQPQQYGSYDSQYSYGQNADHAYDQGQQTYEQGFAEQPQQQPDPAGYEGYGASTAYNQSAAHSYDASSYEPQQESYAAREPYATRPSYDGASNYNSPSTAHNFSPAQPQPHGPAAQGYWPTHGATVQEATVATPAYDPYQPPAVDQAAEQPHGQPYRYDYSPAPAATDAAVATYRAASPYDPVPAPPVAAANAPPTAAAAARAPSPYDPAPAPPSADASMLSPTLPPQSAVAAAQPPPPQGPPRGPPRGPARDPALSASLEKIAAAAAPTDSAGYQAEPASAPPRAEAGGWPEQEGAHPSEAGEEATSHAAAGAEPWENSGEQGDFGQGAHGWVNELEDAAVTPPATEDAIVPPLLTVTDEDASASTPSQPIELDEPAEEAGDVAEALSPHEPDQVDQAVEALQELDINGEEHVRDDLEHSVTANDDAGEQQHALDETGAFQENPSGYGAGYEAGYEAGYGDGGEGGEAPYSAGYADRYTSSSQEAATEAYEPYGTPYAAQPGLGYGNEHPETEAPVSSAGADPYAPAAGNAIEDPYSPGAAAPATGANGYEPSQWGGEQDPLSEGQPQTEADAEQRGDYNAYGAEPLQQQPQPPHDAYTPSADSTSAYEPSYQADGYGEGAYGSYEPYSSEQYGAPPTGSKPPFAQGQRDLYEDSADVKTPSASTMQTAWPGQDASSDPYASPYAAPATNQGLRRTGTLTQRSVVAENGDSSAYAPAAPTAYDENPYGAPDAQPATPSQERRTDGNSYFENGYHYGSPQTTGGDAGAPTSPYDPGVAAQSYASEASYPSSVAGSGVDMLEQMRSARIPIASFGFGGRLVTYFPTSAPGASSGGKDSGYGGGYGYGGASGSGAPTKVTLHSLSALTPSSSYATAFDPLQFPGPAFEGASATALSRATGGASAGAKAKKAALLKHLDEKIDEVSAGVGYLRRRPSYVAFGAAQDPDAEAAGLEKTKLECQRAEDKVALLKLLRLILEHDAQTTNNPTFDAAVRELLTGQKKETAGNEATLAAPAFPGMGGDFGAPNRSAANSGQTLRTYELKSGFLETVQSLLLRGERREAVQLAVEQKMWAHAMTIASCVDKECWRSVVSRFIEHELSATGASDGGADGLPPVQPSATGGPDLQTLRVAYNVFSGQDPVSVFDLFRPKRQILAGAAQGAEPVLAAGGGGTNAPLPDWKGSVAVVFTNKSANDSAALTAIGDGLAVHGLVEAAHFCYVLAPATSPFGGADTAAVRMTLLGCENPTTSSRYLHDLDGIILSEILEFAQSLAPIAKGQEPFSGIPHLQAYRLIHAYRLAELGDLQRAQKYCEAIAGTLKLSKNSPYLHAPLLSQLKELSERLVGTPQANDSGNWMTRKMQRPTLDGVWGALEGRFTKFIAGDEADPTPSPSRQKSLSSNAAVGPFSHYTAITPDAAAGGMSRQHSYADFNGPPSVPQSRAGSAMDFHHTRRAPSPKHRASSAMGIRQSPRDPYSGWPQPLSQLQPAKPGSASSHQHSFEASRNNDVLQTSEYSGYGASEANSAVGAQSSWNGYEGSSSSRRPSTDVHEYGSQQHSENSGGYPGYGAYAENGAGEQGGSGRDDVPYYGYQPHGAQQSQFMTNVDGPTLEPAEDGGFVSPMDAFSGGGSRTPQPPPPTDYAQGRLDTYDEADEDDLGLGNSSNKKQQQQQAAPSSSDAVRHSSYDSATTSKEDKKETEDDKKPELKPSASTSWLGRLWGRSSSTSSTESTKAKKAHLGEETAFYYDKELKRWVNKKAGDTGSPASPPPPPPRAQTTSPAVAPDRGAGAASAPPMRMPPMGPPPASGAAGAPRSGLGGYSGRATPLISEVASEGGAGGLGGGPPLRNGPGLTRARSNLADHTMPRAAQAPLRPGSTTPLGSGGVAGGSRSGAAKKRPIKSRYVVVD